MPIIYSVVSRGSTVLAEYTTTSGNFTTVTRRILEKIPAQNSKAIAPFILFLFYLFILFFSNFKYIYILK
jgi:vesicle-associated membrane protein 7